jgi:hypothetical protein
MRPNGAVAQLGERWLCKPEVVGSIPISSTASKLSAATWSPVGGTPQLLIDN